MRKTFLLYAFCFAFSIIASTASITVAKELTLRITNKAPVVVEVAIAYLEGDNWIVDAWWAFKPNDSGTITRTIAASNIYIYGQGPKDRVWQGTKYDKKTQSFAVVDNNFKVIAPKHPEGNGLRVVPFMYIQTGDETEFHYTFNP